MCTNMQTPFELQVYQDTRKKQAEGKPKVKDGGIKKATGLGFYSRRLVRVVS